MTDEKALAPIDAGPPTPMALMQRAVDKGASPESLQQLYALHKQVQADEAEQTFKDRLAAFQAECPQIHKGRSVNIGGGGYKFAGLDDIMRQIQPLLSKHGLSVSFDTTMQDANITVVCRVHCGKHTAETTVTLPIPAQMKVNSTQQAGAALSYGKRYALQGALNIVVTDEDTDAAGMGETITEEQAVKLTDMIEAYEVDLPRFLQFAEAESIGEIPASRFQRCFDALKAKGAKR